MKIFNHINLTICFFLIVINYSVAQSGYMDNALNYSRLILVKTEGGVYKQVGVFKVIGTSYLFGEKNKGNLFSPDAKAYNIFLSYILLTRKWNSIPRETRTNLWSKNPVP